VIILARVAYPIAWLLVAIASSSAVGAVLLFPALSLQGLAAGIENSNEMGCWQALTPDELLGRVNATRRSVNRTMAALGALIAGLVVGLTGDRPALIGVIIAFAAAALTAALSPLREAPSDDSTRAEMSSPLPKNASELRPAGRCSDLPGDGAWRRHAELYPRHRRQFACSAGVLCVTF
jgi:MFS family permease